MTVSAAVRVPPLYVAEIVAAVVVATWLVVTKTGTTRLLTPAGTVSVEGTDAIPGLSLVNATTAPPVGAGAVSVTVAEAVPPPWTVVGLMLMVSSDTGAGGGGGGGGGVVTVQPDSRTLTAVTDPSLTSTVQSAGRV